jgi:hypothetical protein
MMSSIKVAPATPSQSQETPSAGQPDPDLERRFRDLANVWQAEVAHLSSTTARVNHTAYREIIALGPVVVPLLLRELAKSPNHWFAALRAITGADPVPPSERGRVDPMTEAWIRWGRDHGYL